MNQKQSLDEILKKHMDWLLKKPEGERANLSGAYLSGADLRDANLRGAYLSCANLRGAYLSGADLSGAYLSCANLSGADLSGADLSRAELRGANLSRAELRGANLSCANLNGIKEDFFLVLLVAQAEVLGLYDALMKGKIDGIAYNGECACLVGTIAKVRNEDHNELTIDLKPNADRASERWFLGIKKGDIPQNNPISAISAEWMREFMDREKIKYPKYEIVAIEESANDS